MVVFESRESAGKELASRLQGYKKKENVVVFAIPRGGVPVAYEISRELGIPFFVYVTRKLPIPFEPEAGFGAVAEDGTIFLNDEILSHIQISQKEIDETVKRVTKEIKRRVFVYRENKPLPKIKDATVIIVDDGLATGWTVAAAIRALRKKKPKKIIVASPCSSASAYEMLKKIADDVVCIEVSSWQYFAVASFYKDFNDMTDEEVVKYIKKPLKKIP